MSAAQPVTFGGCVINGIGILFMLVGATIGMSLYKGLVQRPRCYDYAARKQLPDLEFLEYKDVVIASNQFHGHICMFTDTRTGFPVSLRFDEADIPAGVDTLNVFASIGSGLAAIGTYFLALSLLRRAGHWLWKTAGP